jgi:O-antigen/teichoic acid export membrane protein
VAARLFSQQAVGYAAAALSAMTLLGTIGVLGLGTLLIGELPRRSDSRAGLVAAALLASGIGSLALSIAFVIVAPHFSSHFTDASGSISRAAIFCVGVVINAMTQVFDQATIGLLRGGLQLGRNFTFALTKIIALVIATVILHDAFGMSIIVSWVSCSALSVVPVGLRLWQQSKFSIPKPDWRTLQSLSRTLAAHCCLNLSIQVPVYLITVISASIVSPSANAGFYAAWTVANVLYALPVHLSTVLFAVASADPQVIARKLRFALGLSILLGIPGMAVTGLGAHLILSLFGPGYARVATVPMWLLVAAYLPTIPKVFYVAVCRALGRISQGATVLTVFAALEMAAAVGGGLKGGLIGLSFGLLVVAVLETLVTAPVVIRTATRAGKHRRRSAAEAGQAVGGVSQQNPSISDGGESSDPRAWIGVERQNPQLAALELLLSLASTSSFAAVDGGSPTIRSRPGPESDMP